MRVENGALNSAPVKVYAQQSTRGATGSRSTTTAGQAGPDSSSLSSAADLVSLAKTLMPADRMQQFQAVHAAVGAGTYETDPSVVSQALIQAHIQS